MTMKPKRRLPPGLPQDGLQQQEAQIPAPSIGTQQSAAQPQMRGMMQAPGMDKIGQSIGMQAAGNDIDAQLGIVSGNLQRMADMSEHSGIGPGTAAQQPEQEPGGGINPLMVGDSSIMGAGTVGEEQVREAERVLREYKSAKKRTEQRIIRAQNWWKLRNWNEIESTMGAVGSGEYKSNTAWLWNCIVGKHADAMDAFPEPNILPRAQDDKEEAQRLTEIVPVVLQQNGFEETYSDVAWQKMQEGTGIYGVFWDKDKLNGLGDIAISRISALNIFFEPGVNDIQESRHVFHCALEDNDLLIQKYPELQGKLGGGQFTLAHYMYDDTVRTDEKSVVVDWYYHKWDQGRKILHYCKFVGETVLYATENDPEYAQRGLYDDGDYPFVFDALYPIEGSPYGFGLIDIGKDTQADIDLMNQAMVRNAVMSSTPRYFIRKDGAVNEQEFADWSAPLIHVSGNLGNDSVQPVQVTPISGMSENYYAQKVEELKFVTGNVDINNGSTPSGVTAASAIAALKEDAGRSSKDSSKASYRSYAKIVTMVIERLRQFYDMPRQFRIIGQNGQERFEQYSNEGLQMQAQGSVMGQDMGMRKPVFDVEVRPQRENVYTKTAQNELALQLYQLGLLNPQNADQSLMVLDMMDFRGKDELVQKVQQGQTMMQMIQQLVQLTAAVAQKNGDQAAMMALQQVVTGQQGDPGMAPQMGGAPAEIRDGDATGGGLQAEHTGMTKGAATRMNGMAERMAEAKSPTA